MTSLHELAWDLSIKSGDRSYLTIFADEGDHHDNKIMDEVRSYYFGSCIQSECNADGGRRCYKAKTRGWHTSSL